LFVAENLFSDHIVWPDSTSLYYLGVVPSIAGELANPLNESIPIIVQRLMTRIANAWHTQAIRLASRIWG
ncbi:hypothetical protein R3P38DRAFT_2415420, partial [Favolaschia claudopus]